MLAASVLLTLALNAEVFAAAPAPAPPTDSYKQALANLSRKELAEIEQIRRQKRDQTKAVERNYRQQRFQIMEQHQPGSTALAKQMNDLHDQNQDDLDALSDKEWDELQAFPRTIKLGAVHARYNAQKKALLEAYDKKMAALRARVPPSPPAAAAAKTAK